VSELLPLIKLKTRVVNYNDMLTFLRDFIDAKMAYNNIVEKDLQDDITSACRKDILSTLDETDFRDKVPGTIVLYDDAINVFKIPRHKPLNDLLFQNRQPKITYFLCVQDGFGIPPQIKRNLDTCIIFGGFTDTTMIAQLLRQVNGSSQMSNRLLGAYLTLSNREGLLFDYLPSGCAVSLIPESGIRLEFA
jgi:hypothetical protein